MNIKRAKQEIKDSIEAYLAKDEFGDVYKRQDQSKSMREMDELLFQFPELVDYCVRSVGGKKEITALFISDNGEELIRNVCAEKNIISLDCRKAEWSDRALYQMCIRDRCIWLWS